MRTLIKKTALQAAFVLLAGVGANSAWAAASCSQTTSAQVVDILGPVLMARDAPVGTSLSGWMASDLSTTWYICIVTEGSSTGMAFRVPLPLSGLTKTVDGITYNVYATGVEGLGMIVGGRTYANGCGWSAFQAITQNWNARRCSSQGSVTNAGQIRFMFVKTGPLAATAPLSPTTFAIARPVYAPSGGSATLFPGMEINLLTMPTEAVAQACTTPDVSVFLDSPKTSVFSGKDSSSPVVAFDISLNECTEEMKAIHYQIDAVTPIIDHANAVIGLDASSTATGVGIQLLDGDGNPLVLGTKRPFTGYNATMGGNFKIPLRARYRQTGNTVTPGSANSAVTFTMTYL